MYGGGSGGCGGDCDGDGDDSTKMALIKYADIELQNGAPKWCHRSQIALLILTLGAQIDPSQYAVIIYFIHESIHIIAYSIKQIWTMMFRSFPKFPYSNSFIYSIFKNFLYMMVNIFWTHSHIVE